MENIKAIIFDWGHTLYQSDTKQIFSKAEEILKYCQSKGYRLTLVSLVTKIYTPDTPKKVRIQQIENSAIKNYFEKFFVTDTDKDKTYDEMVKYLELSRDQILILDDRTIRGIRYGNQHGHPTVWLQSGKFANELPNEETGQPTYTIHSLEELRNIL